LQPSPAINFKQIEESLKRNPFFRGVTDIQSFRVDMRRNINQNDVNYDHTIIFDEFPRDVNARPFVGQVAATTHLDMREHLENALQVSPNWIPHILISRKANLPEMVRILVPSMISEARAAQLPMTSRRHLSTLFESVLGCTFRVIRLPSEVSSVIGVLKTTTDDDNELMTLEPVLFHEFLDAENGLDNMQAPNDAEIPSKKTIVDFDQDGQLFVRHCEGF